MSIIIDTDPGVDDALAIMYALLGNLEIDFIATVFGNSTIANTTRNALTILELLKSEIPCYVGSSKPLSGRFLKPKSHGENGFGGYIKKDLIHIPEKVNAIDKYISLLEASNKKEKTIVCMGPSTNIASAIAQRPDLLPKIKELIILGGAINGDGNITKYAEFNVHCDPIALKILIDSNVSIKLIPAETCRQVIFKKEDIDFLATKGPFESIRKICENYLNYYTSQEDQFSGFTGGVMYDLLTIAYLIDPTLITFTRINIDVNTSQNIRRGETFIGGENNIKLATHVKSKELKNNFFQIVTKSNI